MTNSSCWTRQEENKSDESIALKYHSGHRNITETEIYQVSRIRRETHAFELRLALSRWRLEMSRICEQSCYFSH